MEQKITLPADAGPHHAANIEWWYAFSFLNGDRGSTYALMVSFFRVGELSRHKGHYLIYSLIDLNNKTHSCRSQIDRPLSRHMLALYLPLCLLQRPKDRELQKLYKQLLKGEPPTPHTYMGSCKVQGNPTKVLYDKMSLAFTNEQHDAFQLEIAEQDMTLELQFTPRKPVSFINGDGTPGDLAYYSFTRNEVIGMIKRKGTTECLSGDGWFDHQWGKGYSLLKGVGWNWFGLQLDDGRELLLSQNHSQKTGEVFSPMANLIEKDGMLRFSDTITMKPLQHWQSLRTNAKYPVQWELVIPDFHMKLRVTALFPKQEMMIIGPLRAIWEGACSVDLVEMLPNQTVKKVRGKGFVELVGYMNK